MSHRHLGADAVVHAELPRAHAEMNLTPLIDILLVLLVIFLAALPLTQKAIDSQLPQRPTVTRRTGRRRSSWNTRPIAVCRSTTRRSR